MDHKTEICIICSLSKEEECKKVKEVLSLMGFSVQTPFDHQNFKSLYLIQKHYLGLIESCDIVLVIPKYLVHGVGELEENYSEFRFDVGESVSYEIAYARKIGKPVIFGMLPFVEEKEENKNVSGDDETLCQGSLFWQSVEAKGV